MKSWKLASIASLAALALAAACTGEGASAVGVPLVDGYGRSLTARCAPAPASGATSCSGVEIGPAPAGIVVPGDIIDGQTGWGALDLQSAYNIPTTLPTTATIAILTAGYNPALEADLAVYRAHYALADCTSASGCLRIVDASGGTSFSAPNYDDIAESSLEVQVASAGCPSCKLLIVVATDDAARTPTLPELAAAANEAVNLGATAMVTSYGASELDQNGESWAGQYEKLFATAPQVPLFAASGDGGYLDGSSPGRGVRVPAAFPEVVAVGGTALTPVAVDVSQRRWTETPLATASSGCSSTFAKPSWQHDTGCTHRTLNDLAAAADGALVYFTTVDPAFADADTSGEEQPGWHTEGGTGESAALAAAIFAAAGQAYNGGPAYSYMNPSYFNDLVGGENGSCGSNAYLCSGQIGYDGPSGNGSPNGGVFQGTWLELLAGINYSVPRGGSDGGQLDTLGYWAQTCRTLTFYATDLPAGVAATFGDRQEFFGNPLVQFALTATLDAPLVQAARASLVVDCDGVVHTLSIFVDVVPCRIATSCLLPNGVPALCGANAPDGCGGIIACAGCGPGYSCVAGTCMSPPSPPGPGDH